MCCVIMRTDRLSVLAVRINTGEINLEDVDIRAKSICGGLVLGIEIKVNE